MGKIKITPSGEHFSYGREMQIQLELGALGLQITLAERNENSLYISYDGDMPERVENYLSEIEILGAGIEYTD